MIVDSYKDITLNETPGSNGMHYYVVYANGKRRKSFKGESAYANAERFWNDEVNKVIYSTK